MSSHLIQDINRGIEIFANLPPLQGNPNPNHVGPIWTLFNPNHLHIIHTLYFKCPQMLNAHLKVIVFALLSRLNQCSVSQFVWAWSALSVESCLTNMFNWIQYIHRCIADTLLSFVSNWHMETWRILSILIPTFR